MNAFSLARLVALLRKESIQILRDRMTLRIIILIPIMQLFLFGFAINSDPKHLPAGLLSIEDSKYTRTIAAALTNSGYYDIRVIRSEKDAEAGLARGDLMFVIQTPPDFDRAVDRGEQPSVLIDADATDPTAIGNAVAALGRVVSDLNRDLPPVRRIAPQTQPFQFVVHARYNPEQLTVLNVVPGLVCMVLLFSTLFVTTMAITKERERGTMENLLAMPVKPVEVMIAKIAPYVVIGYIQVALILMASSIFFGLPLRGSVPLLLAALGVFIASNLALGVTFSTVSANQMQAVQLAQFTLLPSFMLSGFMFPFRGMPVWAQVLGSIFPTTHAMRIVRGLLLKGNGWSEIAPELWPMALFTVVTVVLATLLYRETID
ncbi:MAG: ABC transporter permease [Hyphomicrobiales bacterium]|nr:ABC transporter permease [Hyphomicrobiales bacterium]